MRPPTERFHTSMKFQIHWLSSGSDPSPDSAAAGLFHTFLLIYRYEPSARYLALSALNLCCFQEWSLLLVCFMFAFLSQLPSAQTNLEKLHWLLMNQGGDKSNLWIFKICFVYNWNFSSWDCQMLLESQCNAIQDTRQYRLRGLGNP